MKVTCILFSILGATGSSYPEDRQRYWNGYLLFYERVEDPKTPVSAKKSKVIRMRNKEEQRYLVIS